MDVDIGQVVRSKAGRDKGRYFIVIGIEGSDYAFIADGVLRKVENPKKKKLKHLEIKNELIGEIKEKISNSKRLSNSDIRKALEALGYMPKGEEV
ncbi:KOW domain-containing RNA-binding protein [Mahella australiensis]|uniref:LSU ribosomal protein L14E n=1 Tax=Mahella australiensis (strain DSM 15567 / CIP 107919 / 50-1 BON) TaxID=697281 RepID=F4A2W2_MAHA5|nr:KOW domain-containing RNA-binding protein [Mahella australiensis]AEE97305.1 LSU ribosomal protein L14E [Mahella australiensis 50-1 BON]